MKASIREKLDRLADRHQELSGLLSDPEVIADQESFRRLSKEFAGTEPVIRDLEAFREAESELAAAREMAGDADPGIRELGEEEQLAVQERLAQLEARLLAYLVPRDPYDDANIFLEIRAGTGGDEAALFAGDLFRMYSRYAESRGWRVEILSASEGEHGGFREIICRVVGHGAYSRLKFESGAHRVQRVPETESQGRIHTSACTVAVLPELDEVEAVTVDASELRVDTYRSSGAGGQHVNKTDSAVRLTHLPTGIVVECQEERSQHKNRARAMALLQAKLTDERRRAQDQAQAAERKSLVGSGDRSERIRTYNFPQGRITDHRINLTLYKLDSVIQGDLEAVIEPLLQEHQAALIGQVSGD